MLQNDIIQKTEEYVREMLAGDTTGHDWWHSKHEYMEEFIKQFLREWDF